MRSHDVRYVRWGLIGLVSVLMMNVAVAAPESVWQVIVRPWLIYRWQTSLDGGKTPTQAIKDIDSTLANYHVGSQLTEAQLEENRAIKERVVKGTFDLRELSRISLGRHWTTLSDAERDRFVQLMTDLLEKKAILSKEQGQKKANGTAVYSVVYRGDKYLDPIKDHALTKTVVYVKSQNAHVALDYKLRRASPQWKIYDVIVDGSSLVENYQYQFDNIITKNGYPELIHRMEKKLTELQSGKSK